MALMHDDQLAVDADVVAALVARQFPEWRDELVEPVTSGGTVNAIFRVGERLAARFPLRDGDPASVLGVLRAEARAMDELTASCPVPTPQVTGLGEPGEGYPLPWSVQTWLPGETATPDGLASTTVFAQDLAGLVRALRSADTRGRKFTADGRGGLLADHDGWVRECLSRSGDLVDVPAAAALWERARGLPAPPELAMCHRDLIPGNLLVAGQRLVGVLDGGGFAAADPAVDLVAGWHLLDADARGVFREELDCGDEEWARGAGWALEQSLGIGWYYRGSNPGMSALGRSTVARLLAADADREL